MPYYKAFIVEDEKLISNLDYEDNTLFEVGKGYRIDIELKLGKTGFHCYRHPNDCYMNPLISNYPILYGETVIHEVDPFGKLLWRGDNVLCTNMIKIGRRLSQDEIDNCYTQHMEKHFGQTVHFKNGKPYGKYKIIDERKSEYWYKDEKLHRDEVDPKTRLPLPAVIEYYHEDEDDPTYVYDPDSEFEITEYFFKDGVRFYPIH